MAKECEYCGFRDPLPFTCKFCGNSYCYNHRLPESHNCSGLVLYKKKILENGKPFLHEKEFTRNKYKGPAYHSLSKAISTVTSNYSLTILALAIISFFLQYIIPGYTLYLELVPLDVLSRPWILITHIFLHSGPIHLLFNMIFLFFFGPELERRIGGKRFLAVFFISGIVAAIGYSLWSLFIIGNPFASAVGASGALFGIFACLVILAPHIRIYVYFIPMKITHALVFFALFDLLFIGSGDLVARSAHLSGVAAGLLMGMYIKKTGQYIGY